jgi:Ca-activated chloride channel homolog
MSPRLRRILWILTLLGLLAAGFFVFRKYVLAAAAPTLAFTYQGIKYELLSPRMLGVALLLPLFLYVVGKSLADLPWPQRVMSVLLRFAFVCTLGVALARLSRTATTSKVCTVFVVDVSESIPAEALGDAKGLITEAIRQKPKDDAVRVITFARRPRTVDLPEDGSIPDITRHDAAGEQARLGSGSNLQAALQLAYGLFPPGHLKRIVLLSDGLETDGDVLAEAGRARQFGIHISGGHPRAQAAGPGEGRRGVRDPRRCLRQPRHLGEGAPLPG